MKRFQYKAWRDANLETGELSARDEQDAHQRLIELGLIPESLTQKIETVRPLSMQQQAALISQLAMLIKAGVSLRGALNSLAKQHRRGPVASIMSTVIEHVNEGASLGRAMAASKGFSDLVPATLAAAEASGQLSSCLTQLSAFLNDRANLRSQVRRAMSYPMTVLVVTVLITVFLLTSVIPQLAELYADQGVALPSTTQLLISLSTLLTSHPWASAGAGVTLILSLRWLLTRAAIVDLLQRVGAKLPLVGSFMSHYLASIWVTTLHQCVSAGVPLHHALTLSSHQITHRSWQPGLTQMAQSIERGDSLREGLDLIPHFSDVSRDLIVTGFHASTLAEALGKSAEFEQLNFKSALDRIIEIVPTLALLVMGLVVLGIVSAVLTPIFQLNQVLT